MVTIQNDFLNQVRTLRESDEVALRRKAEAQLQKWAQREVDLRVRGVARHAKQSAREESESADAEARETLEEVRNILKASLDLHVRIDWAGLRDKRKFSAPGFGVPQPQPIASPEMPAHPKKPFWSWLIPALGRKWQAECAALQQSHARVVDTNEAWFAAAMVEWHGQADAHAKRVDKERGAFAAAQQEHNEGVRAAQQRFEGGDPEEVRRYLALLRHISLSIRGEMDFADAP